MHLAKLARDSVERGRSEDLKALSKRSQAREEELNSFITDMEEQHSKLKKEPHLEKTALGNFRPGPA